MPQPKPTREDIKLRKLRAEEWRAFRRDCLLTQRRLADILNISRRTVQQVEAAKVNPHRVTLLRFAACRSKFEADAKTR
jgi:DNA-binding XRE family transcriptional regulator